MASQKQRVMQTTHRRERQPSRLKLSQRGLTSASEGFGGSKSSTHMRKVLTKKDLPFLVEKLHNVRDNWMNIGLQLGVDYSPDLQDIEKDGSNLSPSSNKCLMKMLIKAIDCSINMDDICTALRSAAVGEHVLAQSLMEHDTPHQSTLNNVYYNPNFDDTFEGEEPVYHYQNLSTCTSAPETTSEMTTQGHSGRQGHHKPKYASVSQTPGDTFFSTTSDRLSHYPIGNPQLRRRNTGSLHKENTAEATVQRGYQCHNCVESNRQFLDSVSITDSSFDPTRVPLTSLLMNTSNQQVTERVSSVDDTTTSFLYEQQIQCHTIEYFTEVTWSEKLNMGCHHLFLYLIFVYFWGYLSS